MKGGRESGLKDVVGVRWSDEGTMQILKGFRSPQSIPLMMVDIDTSIGLLLPKGTSKTQRVETTWHDRLTIYLAPLARSLTMGWVMQTAVVPRDWHNHRQ